MQRLREAANAGDVDAIAKIDKAKEHARECARERARGKRDVVDAGNAKAKRPKIDE